jgi:hypothetical protein
MPVLSETDKSAVWSAFIVREKVKSRKAIHQTHAMAGPGNKG